LFSSIAAALQQVSRKVNSFPSSSAHRKALIFISVALSQTPAYAVTMDTGLVHSVVCMFMPELLLVPIHSMYQQFDPSVRSTLQGYMGVNNYSELSHSWSLAGDKLAISRSYHCATKSEKNK